MADIQLVGRRVHIAEHPVEIFLVGRTGFPGVYRGRTLEVAGDDHVLFHALHHVIERHEFAGTRPDELYPANGFRISRGRR